MEQKPVMFHQPMLLLYWDRMKVLKKNMPQTISIMSINLFHTKEEYETIKNMAHSCFYIWSSDETCISRQMINRQLSSLYFHVSNMNSQVHGSYPNHQKLRDMAMLGNTIEWHLDFHSVWATLLYLCTLSKFSFKRSLCK